ncbi:lipase family protein, partial [Campylobacter helveticus]|uniref:lipase family protein n=1 Tax=Campylobacter helveticus TaxID=28898 RepID=UPI002149CE4C
IKFHQPNTTSGFSATLFYDKEKDKFVVGFRGTEISFKNIKTDWETILDAIQDANLTFGKGDFQANALKQFLLNIAPILNGIDSNKIIFVGHSLGGYLAVMAMQFCDTIDRTQNTQFNNIKFSASQVYTFNAPAIGGIDNMLMRVLAELLDKNIMELVLNPQKVYYIYDNGGIEVAASAQYGANNALGIYTGENDHSIKSLVTTLYFYTYLLELKENENKIIKNNSLKESLENLNHFMKNIEIYTKTFITKNHKINKNVSKNNYEALNSFEFFLSQIAFIMQENENYTDENYSSIYQSSIIKQDEIIDFILKAQEKEYYILILHQNDFDKYRKDCSFINQKDNLAYKIALGEFRIFIIVDKDLKCLEKIDNIHKIYGYNSKAYHIINQIWDELYLGGVCKISQALYFNGKAKVDIA